MRKMSEVINPYTNEVVGCVPVSTEEEINAAVENADRAFKDWKRTTVYDRVQLVKKFLELVEENREELELLLSKESGKKLAETKTEISNILESWTLFSEKARHIYESVIPSGLERNQANNLVMVKREPLGVIACIIPFNFPCNLFSQKAAPALLAGNCVIVKPASDNPLTVMRLVELLHEAGVPEKVIQTVNGSGREIGDLLTEHEGIAAISLTGSTCVGKEVAKKSAFSLKKMMLELGGNDAFIVLEDADLDKAVNEACFARFFNAGQICCAPKRFLIQESVYEEFIQKVTDRVAGIHCGDPLDENTGIGTLINVKAAQKVKEQIDLTISQGAKLVLGGEVQGAMVTPAILRDIPHSADVMHDMEIFGPVIPITSFKTKEEAVALANDSVYGLGAAVFTGGLENASYFSTELECGMVVINGSSYFRTFEMPFGGWKQSGVGNEGVFSTFEEMTQIKNIVIKGI